MFSILHISIIVFSLLHATLGTFTTQV